MNSRGTRRAFLAEVTAAAVLQRIGYAQETDAATEIKLKTDAPLEQFVPPLEQLVARVMTKLNVPGLSVALIRDAEIVWAKGFGVKQKETADAVDDSTVFEAASLTKPVLAYAALALGEQGKLELDQPLADYLSEPPAAEQPELLAQVTARHVLTHTTGLPNWGNPGRPLKFRRPPGEKFSYSGEGFVYLQRVVEQLEGAPLDEYLQEKMFAPLKMTSASLVWKDEFGQTLAHGHNRRGQSSQGQRRWAKANAASSLVCTAADYAKFVCALLAPPQAAEGLLPLRAVAQLWKPQVEAADGISWGLGLGVEHTPNGDAFWHWGNNNSRYHCFVVAFPLERIGVVVFTNSGNGLKACTEIVPAAIGGDHPALRWKMVVR
jgi:CubicO group peptidase (beta-lactamase class C family)